MCWPLLHPLFPFHFHSSKFLIFLGQLAPLWTVSDQVRPGNLTTGRFPFKYSRFVSTACHDVWILVHDRPASASRRDGIGQDRKCLQHGVERHNRTVSRQAEPQSGLRVVEVQ